MERFEIQIKKERNSVYSAEKNVQKCWNRWKCLKFEK